MVAQWAVGIPEVEIAADGSLVRIDADVAQPVDACFDTGAHGGLLEFLELAALHPMPPARVKAQITGPLTLGVALLDAGLPAPRAWARAAEAARAWGRAVEALVAERLPGAALVLFFDEPALSCWRGGDGPLEREEATDLLSGALAGPSCTTGVHVCGDALMRVALDAGPEVLGVDVAAVALEDAIAIARFLEGDGWIAWGAVPTDRPVGESAQPHWRALVDLWCELTRRGCDQARLRRQALVTPACGLAGHGASQAERAMRLAREIGDRVHDQAVATKLTVGA
jgi:hypothetical protein